LIWDFQKKIHRSISTVSIDPETGLLFIRTQRLRLLPRAETGKKYWEYDMKAHMWGSTFVADGKCYVVMKMATSPSLARDEGRTESVEPK